MIKSIRLLVEGFFDDEIFDVGNDIKSDIEDLGRYYDYQVADIYYLNDKPYAICCSESKYFKDDKPRFCLLNDADNRLKWRTNVKLVKKLGCFDFKNFYLHTFKDFQHIDNYDISEFPAFKYCIELGDNVYLPSIDELQIMYLNKDKLSKYSFNNGYYWSSTQYSADNTYNINTVRNFVHCYSKYNNFRIRPFLCLE